MRFSSKYYDKEVGLYYFGHRYYDPAMGRFLNRDPIAEEGGLNLYGYVENDPVNKIDPTGLEPKVATQVGYALANGDIKFATYLIQNGIRNRASSATVSAVLGKIYDKFPAISQKCDKAVQLTTEALKAAGHNTEKIKIVGARGERFFFLGKDKISSTGEHFAVYCNGRVYDALTGSAGASLSNYQQYWINTMGVNPIITDSAGKVLK